MNKNKVLKILGNLGIHAYAFAGWMIAIYEVRRNIKIYEEERKYIEKHNREYEEIKNFYTKFLKERGIEVNE